MSNVIPFTQTDPQGQKIRIELPSNTEFVGPLMNFLNTLLKNMGVEDTVISNVVTAVIEAVANAMKHGNRSDLSKKVTVIIYLMEKTMRVEIQDEGAGFDLDIIPDPLAPENLTKLTGRGIFLMKSFMDKVAFDFTDQGSRIMMEKKFA
jgi:serine/threonine-protein kinase RsbW